MKVKVPEILRGACICFLLQAQQPLLELKRRLGFVFPDGEFSEFRANQIVCMAPGYSQSHITHSLLLIVFVV